LIPFKIASLSKTWTEQGWLKIKGAEQEQATAHHVGQGFKQPDLAKDVPAHSRTVSAQGSLKVPSNPNNFTKKYLQVLKTLGIHSRDTQPQLLASHRLNQV